MTSKTERALVALREEDLKFDRGNSLNALNCRCVIGTVRLKASMFESEPGKYWVSAWPFRPTGAYGETAA